MMRCPPLCGRNMVVKEDIEWKKKIRKKIRNVEKADRDEWKQTTEEKFNEEIELNREKVREIVPRKFHKWLKVFEKAESERMPTRKPQNHVINLKEDFVPKKKRTYLMSRQEKEEVQEFIEEQLRNEYIRPSKSLQTLLVFFVGKRMERKEQYKTTNTSTRGQLRTITPCL